LQVFAFNS